MKKTILIVDDSPSIRRMVAMTLGEIGYDVIEATDGRDGLAKALKGPCDGIITDQNMPNMDGLTFIREFRQQTVSRGVPIIVLSTDSDDTLRQRAREAGAIGWMVKPFDQAKLTAVLRKVIG
ncbi:MAG: response regulator [Rhodobacteraceae bacterium]|nr:response regulator [Paracoccaceae bacterium]MCF8515164.1 response regulator [Paracoccaceae bacterium]MCF8519408.1 response regulator [Paracoccaceae bacterium]